MPVARRHIKLLEPYLVGSAPKENGEWDMHCPLHEDSKRSASMNVKSGDWWCFAGCGGGRVTTLIKNRHRWVAPDAASFNGRGTIRSPDPEPKVHVSQAMVSGWHSALMSNDAALEEFIAERGITTDTVIKYEIGWDIDRSVYTIPVKGPRDEIWNVRSYDLHPREGRRKIWGVTGMNTPRLYPIDQLEADRVVLCEGELDALITIQNGYPAVTRTGAADVWKGEWAELFAGKTVYLCHDMDHKGQTANRKVARMLRSIADVRLLLLPYEITEKHGMDLTDFWREYDAGKFEQLLADAKRPTGKTKRDEPETISVLDSFDAKLIAKPVRLIVTIKGKKDPGYTVPSRAKLSCTRDAGAKCAICPLNAAGGEAEILIAPDNPAILAIMESKDNEVKNILRQEYGALKCDRLTIEPTTHQSVEVLYARPSIDHVDGTQAESYKNIRITNVGTHDTMPNNTVALTGSLHSHPRDQRNDFLSWEIEKLETSIDKFEITKESLSLMRRFKVRKGQRPAAKLMDIAKDLSLHVTKIIGRPEMHAFMDLTFHSVMAFKFSDQMVSRGWIDSIVYGDTRTGKSEAAAALVRHFGAGEVIGGEAASYAGVVGGLQQMGGREWAVTWGVVPINDRRLVVIDETSGLSPDDIARMSDVRASGIARLTMIQQEVTHARTRLLWLSNPRHSTMGDYTYGVDAIRPLIGNAEDIARFDMAMAVSMDDVPIEDINKPREQGDLKYTGEACHTLLMWAWTRQPDQIVWARGAEARVFKLANLMGKKYVEDPPLVQAANIRIKIARVAVALAARLFSTDDTYERIIVKPEHVVDAVAFLDRIYDMRSFGYASRSREIIEDRREAHNNKEDIKKYLLERRGLAKFLRNLPRFRRQDLEEIMNIPREEANAIINRLWDARMVRKESGDVRVEPTLHDLLREVRW